MKEFRSSGENIPLSSICDSERNTFKIRIGEEIPRLEECEPWILFDSVQVDSVSVSIPGDYVGVPNLRVAGKYLRENFILREIEPTGSASYTYQFYTPFGLEPPTEFYLPASFKYTYDDELIDFPALPVVDLHGSLATINDIEVKVNGEVQTVIDLDPVTGWVKIEYPETDLLYMNIL